MPSVQRPTKTPQQHLEEISKGSEEVTRKIRAESIRSMMHTGEVKKALSAARIEYAYSGQVVLTPGDIQQAFTTYLGECETYGTYRQRCPEYMMAHRALTDMGFGMTDEGLVDPDGAGGSVLDVGAGSCDFGRYLYTECGFTGQYVPVDGSLMGDHLEFWSIPEGVQFDWVVSIETIEHVADPERLVHQLVKAARKGVVMTTPNPDIVDVLAVDPTHLKAVSITNLQDWVGASVETVGFNGRGGSAKDGYDTIIAMVNKQS